MEPVRLFISTVSSEFKKHREYLYSELKRPGIDVEIQENFINYGQTTLCMLDEYIQSCSAVIHLAGDETGSIAGDAAVACLRERYPDLAQRLPQLSAPLEAGENPGWSYTQWEAYLAILHGKRLYICRPDSGVSKPEQSAHLDRLRDLGFYPLSPDFASPDRLVISIYRELADILSADRNPIFTLGPTRGDFFVGRDELLGQINEKLRTGRAQQTGGRIVLWGLGGIGKTQLAVEYGHLKAPNYDALLFVSASSPEVLDTSVGDLCEFGALNLDQRRSDNPEVRRNAATRWLLENDDWLLMIDNADDADSLRAAEDFVRNLRGGDVILTTRMDRMPFGFAHIELPVLPKEAARDFLLRSTEGRRMSTGDDEAAAMRVAEKLGFLALGLAQASAYLGQRRDFTFQDYLDEWQRNAAGILDDPDFDQAVTGYPANAAVTWTTSVKQLGDGGRRLLEMLAWCAAEPIPRRLILKLPEETFPNPRSALEELYRYSLAQLREDHPGCLLVHRLVQEVSRIRQRRDGIAETRIGEALEMIESDFVRSDRDIANLTLHILPQLLETAPHAREILDRAAAVPAHATRPELVRILTKFAEIEITRGQMREAAEQAGRAVELGRQGATDRRESLASDLALQRALSLFSYVQRTRGKLAEAYETALEGMKIGDRLRNAFPDDIDCLWATCEAVNYFAGVLESQGKNPDALKFFQHSHRLAQQLVEAEPENLAHQRELSISFNNLGRIAEKQGDNAKAAELFDDSRRQIAQQLVEAEPENLAHQRDLSIAFNNLGRIAENQGDNAKAAELFDQARQIRKQLVEAEPENLAHQRELSISFNNLGRIAEKQGDNAKAAELFDDSRQIAQQLVEAEPENLAHQRELSISFNNLGRIAENQGDNAKAAELFDDSRQIAQQLVEAEPENLAHQRDLSISLENLGRIAKKQGDNAKAAELFDDSRQIRKQLVEAEPENLAHQRELAITLYYVGQSCSQAGNLEACRKHWQDALRIFENLRDQGADFGDLESNIAVVKAALKL